MPQLGVGLIPSGPIGDELETTVRIAIEETRPGSDIRTLARQAVTGAVRLAMAKARAPYRA